ncbi:hypothetical protein ACET3Z_018935 [Daucus carota]
MRTFTRNEKGPVGMGEEENRAADEDISFHLSRQVFNIIDVKTAVRLTSHQTHHGLTDSTSSSTEHPQVTDSPS